MESRQKAHFRKVAKEVQEPRTAESWHVNSQSQPSTVWHIIGQSPGLWEEWPYPGTRTQENTRVIPCMHYLYGDRRITLTVIEDTNT